MIRKKYQSHKVPGTPTRVRDINELWSEDYQETYAPNIENLFKRHKVPKYRRRFRSTIAGDFL
jgi:hypothetical protein